MKVASSLSITVILLYWCAAFFHLGAVIGGNSFLLAVTKPLLMPLLIAWYFIATSNVRNSAHWLIMTALAFSCAGDVFLMYKTEQFFLLGLAAFLITHLLYIIAFNLEIKAAGGERLLKKKPYLALPAVALAVFLISLIFNRIELAMRFPVIVYAMVITAMVISALNRFQKISGQSFRLTLAGAVLFMFSDSLIAINKFYFNEDLRYAGFFIMLFYISGQYLIAKGTAKNN
ncbi:MAG TPA: lysoplasmalogenase [Chitinophagales bacterium]|nr:lysoplasmalogenase [Chitinophagales bacterium]